MLALAGPEMPATQPARRELIRRVIVLNPVIDVAIDDGGKTLNYFNSLGNKLWRM
jgi:hypothetical protein